jgi:hypothetical protein
MDNVEKTELTAAEKLAQMEKEKLTRRQALARFGFQAGAAAVAALTADELLRKVGTEMQRRAGDNRVAQQVAKELNGAGVAFADSVSTEDTLLDSGKLCVKLCQDARTAAYSVCGKAFADCMLNNPGVQCSIAKESCDWGADIQYSNCTARCP